MFGKTNMQSDAATFGASKAFNGVAELARIDTANRKARVMTAVYAVAAFAVAFGAALLIMGA